MRREDLVIAIGMVDDGRLARCENNRNPSDVAHREDSKMKNGGKYSTKQKQNGIPRVWLIAAIVTLMLVLMGCTVAYFLRLQEMKIAETSGTQYIDEHGKLVVSNDAGRTVITLHGVSGSPTFLAAQEWYHFTENYDVDGQKFADAEENPIDIPEVYEAYSIYNQEMKDKVDEIIQKYNLKLLGTFAPFQSYERRVFHEALGIESLLIPDSTASIEKESGYFFEAGNFKVEFHMNMLGNADAWPYKMLNTIYYSRADVFDQVYFVTEDLEKWEQWAYTTAGGQEVSISVNASGYGAKVMYNREDALIYVSIENYYVTDWSAEHIGPENTIFMTRQQLEQVVDQIDFTLTVEQVDISLAKEKLHRFQNVTLNDPIQDHENAYDAAMESMGIRSYEDRVKKLIESCEGLSYQLIDITDDGVEELIIGKEDYILYIYTIDGNKTRPLLTNIVGRKIVTYDGSGTALTLDPSYILLCENNNLIYVYEETNGRIIHHFAKLVDGKMAWAEEIMFDPNDPSSSYYQPSYEENSNMGYNNIPNPISESAYDEILDSYVPIDTVLNPLTEYPLP